MQRLTVGWCLLLLGLVVAAPVAAHPADPDSGSPSPAGATPAEFGSDESAGPAAHGGTATTANESVTDGDSLGCVDGICHDDTLNITQTDGLTDGERSRLVDRSMARVEVLRQAEFNRTVPVRVMTPTNFSRNRLATNDTKSRFNRWNDQIWKALFVVGENDSSEQAISDTFSGSVSGFYSPSRDEIVVVTRNTDHPRLSEGTLIHELTHALQDQRFNLSAPRFRAETQDEDLGVTGLFEGVAAYTVDRYNERCTDDRWGCVDTASTSGDGGQTNRAILMTLLQPYSDGPAYVHDIVEREGWDGIDARMRNPPTTSTEIIHQEPMATPEITRTGEATAGWSRYPEQGRNGADVAGEASIFVMFWHQAVTEGADTIDPGVLYETNGRYDQRNYAAPPSAGWAGDAIVPYRRGDENGYVWTLAWETPDDVTEFTRAYRAILDAHNATQTSPGVYVVEDGGFSGAYAVDTSDTRVRIVHAPTTDGLDELAPTLDPDSLPRERIPGFGVGVAVVALVSATLIARRHAR
jgi:PGF-CTERM protein